MISLYWYTLKHLKPAQIVGRFWFRVYKPTWFKAAVLPRRAIVSAGGFGLKKSCMVGPFEFVFLNKRMVIDPQVGWCDRSREALWDYNLHYFDDLNAVRGSEREAWHESYIKAWVSANPIGVSPGWDSYPTSLRIVNWVKFLAGRGGDIGNMTASLVQQSKWLSQRVEHHLQANHLWANAKALVFAGAFFESDEASVWLRKGAKLISRELDEQVLDDGGHYERSPMYHAIVLEDILDLIQLDNLYAGILVQDLVSKLALKAKVMLRWLSLMSRPDGAPCFFNDSAKGIAPTYNDLKSYAEAIGLSKAGQEHNTCVDLEPSGFIVAERGIARLHCNVAPIEPAYQPGHAHADTLSFELSIDGYSLVCNSGISTYAETPNRTYQRSTAAHSTVEVDAENSSEIWRSFRVARRARPFDLCVDRGSNQLKISCKHDGYLRLGKGCIHRREWVLGENSLSLIDQLEGGFRAAVGRIFLSPEVAVEETALDSVSLLLMGRPITVSVVSGSLSLKSASHFPEFGISVSTHCLEIEFESAATEVRITWDH